MGVIPARLTTPGGTDSVTVDQRSGGGRWHLLKTLTLAANDNWQVELSDQSPGEVVADAIAVTPPISLADKFEWAPALPAAGDYAVYAKWQAEPGRATDATYEIAHDGGVAQVSVDQTHNGGEWRYLGSWSFDPLNAPKVTLLGSLTGTLSADAVRFVSGDAIGGDIAYTHADQLGTIQKMTDASGALAWDRTQRPFGETIAINAASGIANPLRFPGQYADETGLSYNYFRDYDPTIGRYLKSDPMGLGGGANTYAYVGGNPIGRVDVLGLQSDEVCPAPDCRQLQLAMLELATAIDRRLMDMRVDRRHLYCLAPRREDDFGHGSWEGHAFSIQTRQNELNELITQANAAGCHVSSYVLEMSVAPIPKWPDIFEQAVWGYTCKYFLDLYPRKPGDPYPPPGTRPGDPMPQIVSIH